MGSNVIHAADLFSGAGGTSTALALACQELGLKLRLTAVNHWPIAIETHAANHPDAEHLCRTLDSVDPLKATGGKLDILVASPECFPAGTMILAERGLVPIEEVVVGDMVLTHQGRWMPINSVMRTVKPTVVLRGHGHFGLETTAEHPFYVRIRSRVWANETRRYVMAYSDPMWRVAAHSQNTFWATPTVADPLPVTRVPGRGADFTPGFWWMVGRWVGDGCLRQSRGEMTITCGNHEADQLHRTLTESVPIAAGRRSSQGEFLWRRRKVRTGVLIETAHKGLTGWLQEHFGSRAGGKTIPSWALTMPAGWRRKLLEGYLSADGWTDGRKHEAFTVSKRLAIGVRLLAESLGYRVALHLQKARPNPIEGRKVQVRDQYHLVWIAHRKHEYGTESSKHSWQRIREVKPGSYGQPVYNLSVDGDESYVADGIVVHNCTHHSNARGGKPCSDQSRATAWHVVRWAEALRPKVILVENVREMLTWGPLGSNGRPLKSKRGQVFSAWISALESVGYRVSHRLVNAADYGGATTRTRLFVMGIRGRGPMPWPDTSHEKTPKAGSLFAPLPRWRAAREVIDWNLTGRSIFGRKIPLKPNTINRIAEGIRRFWGVDPEPFLVRLRGTSDSHIDSSALSVSGPLPTLTSGRHLGLCQPFIVPQFSANAARDIDRPLVAITTTTRGMGLVEPFLMHTTHHGGERVHETSDPLPTITGANRGEQALITPFLIPTNYGERDGQRPRTHSLDAPLPTLVGSSAHGVIEPFLVKYYGNGGGPHSVDRPLDTITGNDRFGLVTPSGEVIADILFRMLQPHELAAGMGFPNGYVFKGTREQVVKQIGNAVEVNKARAHLREMLRAIVA